MNQNRQDPSFRSQDRVALCSARAVLQAPPIRLNLLESVQEFGSQIVDVLNADRKTNQVLRTARQLDAVLQEMLRDWVRPPGNFDDGTPVEVGREESRVD